MWLVSGFLYRREGLRRRQASAVGDTQANSPTRRPGPFRRRCRRRKGGNGGKGEGAEGPRSRGVLSYPTTCSKRAVSGVPASPHRAWPSDQRGLRLKTSRQTCPAHIWPCRRSLHHELGRLGMEGKERWFCVASLPKTFGTSVSLILSASLIDKASSTSNSTFLPHLSQQRANAPRRLEVPKEPFSPRPRQPDL